MIEKILQWGGTIFAVIGVVFLFLEAIGSIRKHSNTKLSILGLVFLSISLVGYLLTEVILRSKGLPVIFSCLWILFMWAYLICNLVSVIKLSKKARAEKKAKQQEEAEQQLEQIEASVADYAVSSEQSVNAEPVADTESNTGKKRRNKSRKSIDERKTREQIEQQSPEITGESSVKMQGNLADDETVSLESDSDAEQNK